MRERTRAAFGIDAAGRATPRAAVPFAGFALAALLAACGGVESEIRDTLGKDLAARGNCLDHRFPVTVHVGPGLFGTRPDLLSEYRVLDDAGVIRRVGEQPRMLAGGVRINEVRLDLTEAGKKAVRDGRLCYGRAEVVKVIDYTEGKAPDGARMVTARVLLRHHVDAEWARDQVFSNRIAVGEEQAEYALVKTNQGWRKAF